MGRLKGIVFFVAAFGYLSISAVSFSGINTIIDINALENPNGSVVFYGETNLPDGTKLDVWWSGTSARFLRNGKIKNPYWGSAEVTVENGQYRTEPLWENGRVFPGKIQVIVKADEYSADLPPDILTALKNYSTLQASNQYTLKPTDLRKQDDEYRQLELIHDLDIVKQMEAETKELFDELMVFTNTREFMEFGASVEGPFREWFEKARSLQDNPFRNKFRKFTGTIAPALLFTLGMDYVTSNGDETDNTIYLRGEIEKLFKTKVELVRN